MHVLLDDGSVKHRNRQNFKSAGYVIFVIMLERQVNLTAELTKRPQTWYRAPRHAQGA